MNPIGNSVWLTCCIIFSSHTLNACIHQQDGLNLQFGIWLNATLIGLAYMNWQPKRRNGGRGDE